jgi:hypothetical protein
MLDAAHDQGIEPKEEGLMTQLLDAKGMSLKEAQDWIDDIISRYSTLNIDAMMSCFTPNVVVNYGNLPQIRGIVPLRKFISDRYDAVTDFKLAKKVRCVTDDVVGLEAVVSYTNAGGKKIQGMAFEFLTIDEGRIAVWDNVSILWDEV